MSFYHTVVTHRR